MAGGELDADEFTLLSGLDEAEAFALLDEAIAAGLLEVSGTKYRFSHSLVRNQSVGGWRRTSARPSTGRRPSAWPRSVPPRAVWPTTSWLGAGASRPCPGCSEPPVGALGDALGFVEQALVHAPGRPDLLDAALLQAMVAHSKGRWPERLRAELLDTRRAPALVCRGRRRRAPPARSPS